MLPFSLAESSFASLKITSLYVSGDFQAKAFEFSTEIQGGWEILSGLVLANLGLNLRYQGGNRGHVDGDMRAVLVLGSGDSALVLDAMAELPTQDTGWFFTAHLGGVGDTPLGFADFVRDCLTPFSLPTGWVPESMNGFEIDDISLTFDTRSKDFTFYFEGDFPIEATTTLRAIVTLELTKQADGGFEQRFGGVLRMELAGGQILEFFLTVDKKPHSLALVGGYCNPTGLTVSVADVLGAAGWHDAPGAGLEFALRQAVLARLPDDKRLFHLEIDAGLNLSALHLPGLPLAGGGSVDRLDLAFQLLAAKGTIEATDIDTANALLPPDAAPLPHPSRTLQDGLFLDTKLTAGPLTVDIPLQIQFKKKPKTGPPGEVLERADESPPGATPGQLTWQNVQRNFGPMHMEKIGVGLDGSKLRGALGGALSAGGLTLSLISAGFNSPIAKPSPTFTLDGLGIDYHNDAIEIGGALMRQEKTVDNEIVSIFNGLAVLRMKTFSLSAIGSFASLKSGVSFFLYAVLNYPLGGPSFFFVTGLSAGFGLHRRLRMPEMDDVPRFPLVALATGEKAAPPGGSNAEVLANLLGDLDSFIPIDPGMNFLCAGIKFTSFNIIDSFALLAVQFGRQLEIDLLGLSTLTVPPMAPAGTPLLAEAQLAVKAVFIPSEGFLGVRAQLTPASFILSPACHLTGGFAFYSWFSGPTAGDFVLTLGGYHPAYKVPAHYPQDVPRLGFNWQVTDSLSFKGGIYYALTGNAFMAGGFFSANYEGGWVRAWFNCGADFLVTFKPFHYDASLYVSMGAEATVEFFGTHHLSFDAGADLHLWGPPLGGHAHVHVKVWIVTVSFDVDFGAGTALMRPIDWTEFSGSFLPKGSPCSAVVENGLLREVGPDKRWIVNARDFAFSATSVIPSSTATCASTAFHADKKFSIQPMGIAEVDGPQFTVTIKKDGAPMSGENLIMESINKPMPAGLWSDPVLHDGYLVPPNLNADPLVPNLLTGVRISAQEPTSDEHCSVDRSNLNYDPTIINQAWKWCDIPEFKAAPDSNWNSAAAALRAASLTREAVLADLGLNHALRDLGEDFEKGSNSAPQLAA
jgi:hypothetical protein